MAHLDKLIPVPQLIIKLKKTFDSTTLYDGSCYLEGMLWTEDNIHLPDSFYASLVQIKSLEKPVEKDLKLKTP